MMALKKVGEWTVNDAKARIEEAVKAIPLGEDGFKITFQMVELHNFWSPGGKEGDGWGGQRAADPSVNMRILKMVKPMFTPDDILGEMVGNVESGLLQREASVDFAPVNLPDNEDPASDTAKARKKEARDMIDALSRWWDEKKFWEVLGKGLRRATWSGRGPLKLRIATPNLAANGQLETGLTLAEAFKRIEVDAPLPDSAGVFIDPETERKIGVVVTKVDDKDTAELWTVEGTGREARMTKCGILSPAQVPGAPVQHAALDLGGRIPVFEIQSEPLITEPMRMGQKQLNFIRTVLGNTIESAGHKARFFTNTEPPLMWFESPPTLSPVVKIDESIPGRKLYGVAQPWIFGAHETTELVGLEKTLPDGTTERHEPTVTIDEPTDTAFVTVPANEVRAWIYKSGKQGHLGGSSTIQLSGDAYEQARVQHEADLTKRKAAVEGVVRDILETVIALAALMSEEAKGFLDEFRCVVNLHIHAGPIRPDQARVFFEARDKRIISVETTMSRFGIEDTEAEAKLLEQDQLAQLELWTKRMAVISQATLAGVEQLVACHFAGLSLEQAEMVVTGQVPGWEALVTKVEEMRRKEAELARRSPDPNAPPENQPPGNRPPAPRPAPRPEPAAA